MLSINSNIFNNIYLQLQSKNNNEKNIFINKPLKYDTFEKSSQISFGENKRLEEAPLTSERKRYWSQGIMNKVTANPDALSEYLSNLASESRAAKVFAFRTVTFLLNKTFENSLNSFDNLQKYLLIYRSQENCPFIRGFDAKAVNQLYETATNLLHAIPVTETPFEDTIDHLKNFKEVIEDHAKSQELCNRQPALRFELNNWLYVASNYALRGKIGTYDVLCQFDDVPQNVKRDMFTTVLFTLAETLDKEEDPLKTFDKFIEIYENPENRPNDRTGREDSWQTIFNKLYECTRNVDDIDDGDDDVIDGDVRIANLEKLAKDQHERANEYALMHPETAKSHSPQTNKGKLISKRSNMPPESNISQERKDYISRWYYQTKSGEITLAEFIDKLQECSVYEKKWIFEGILRLLNDSKLRTLDAVDKFIEIYGTRENMHENSRRYDSGIKKLISNLEADYAENPNERLKDLIDETKLFERSMIDWDESRDKKPIPQEKKDYLFRLERNVRNKKISLIEYMTEMEKCTPSESKWMFKGVLRTFCNNLRDSEETLTALDKFVNFYGKSENLPSNVKEYSGYMGTLLYFVETHFDEYPDQDRIDKLAIKLKKITEVMEENNTARMQQSANKNVKKHEPVVLSSAQERNVDAYKADLERITTHFSNDSVSLNDIVKAISKEAEPVKIHLFTPLLKSLEKCGADNKPMNEAAFRFAEIYWNIVRDKKLEIKNTDLLNLESLREHISWLDPRSAVTVDKEGTIDPARTTYRLFEMLRLMSRELGYPGSRQDVNEYTIKLETICDKCTDIIKFLDKLEQMPNGLPFCAMVKKALFKNIVDRLDKEVAKSQDPLYIDSLINFFSYGYQDSDILPASIDSDRMSKLHHIRSKYYEVVPKDVQTDEVNKKFDGIIDAMEKKYSDGL